MANCMTLIWIFAAIICTALSFMAAFFIALRRESRILGRQPQSRQKNSLTLVMLDRYRNDRAA